MTNTPSYRRPLNSDQAETLELLYKFRFGSVDLVREYFDKSSRGLIFNRLKVLEEQDFIAKRFDSNYRIQGKPAAYYLLPAGARKLQERRDPGDEVNIKSIYKDKSVSETFIAHSLNIFAIYNQLKAQYGSTLDFFTKSDLLGYEHFPNPLPDALLNFEQGEIMKHFILDVLEDSQPFFTDIRKVKKYVDYKRSGDWGLVGGVFPKILFICESVSLQKRLRNQIARMLDKELTSNLTFATTTKEQLKTLSENDAVWQNVINSDETVSLISL